MKLTPAQIPVHVGEPFSVVVGVDAQAKPQYTSKMDAVFTAPIVRFSTWSLGDQWIGLRQSGYDSLDNAAGTLTRTAGYPGGFSGTAYFGTITFVAERAGQATITLGPNSFIYNEESKNTYTGANTVVIDVLPAVLKPGQSEAGANTSSSVSSGTTGSNSATPTVGKTQPSIFDVVLEASLQKDYRIIPYIVIALLVGMGCGVLLSIVFERFKRWHVRRPKK